MNLIKGRLQKFWLSNNFSVKFTPSRTPAASPDQYDMLPTPLAGCQCIVVVIWTKPGCLCSCFSGWLMQLVYNTMVNISHNYSLTATMVTTLWLKLAFAVKCIDSDMLPHQWNCSGKYVYKSSQIASLQHPRFLYPCKWIFCILAHKISLGYAVPTNIHPRKLCIPFLRVL